MIALKPDAVTLTIDRAALAAVEVAVSLSLERPGTAWLVVPAGQPSAVNQNESLIPYAVDEAGADVSERARAVARAVNGVAVKLLREKLA